MNLNLNTVLKKEKKMSEKYLKKKKCSSSLAIREIQIRTVWRFNLTKVRMAKVNKQLTKTAGEGMWRKRSPHSLLGGPRTSPTTLGITVGKLKAALPCDLISPPRGTAYSTDTVISLSIAVLCTTLRK